MQLKMLEVIREIWSNPTLFYQKRINRRRFSKWYIASSGNFCKCSHDTSGFPYNCTWWLIWILIVLYLWSWQPTVSTVKELSMGDVDFTDLCDDPDALGWNLFKKIKLGHKLWVEDYNCTLTRNYILLLDAIRPGFGAFNDLVFNQNRIYKECALNGKKFEEQMKLEYWEILLPTIVYSVVIRIISKSFLMSFFKAWMSRKRYFYIKLGFLKVDLLFISYIAYECVSAYDDMLVRFESDIQSYFLIN